MTAGILGKFDSILNLKIALNGMDAVINSSVSKTVVIEPTEEQIKAWLESQGVVFGIKKEAVLQLADCLSNSRPITDLVIAKGKDPVNGEDGWVDFKFCTTLSAGQIEDDGRVDYYERGIINNTYVDMLIAEIIKETPGEPGRKVTGERISPIAGNPPEAPLAGEGVELSDDELAFYAEIEGHAYMEGRFLNVTREVTIDSDIDFKTGNIDFVGDLRIAGGVLSGFDVRAKGKIIIGTSIELNASVRSESDIHVHDTVRNGKDDKTLVAAAGNIFADKIDNANVFAKGNITVSKEVIGSKIKCHGCFIGKNAEVRGSEIEAVGGIEIAKVGSSRGEVKNVLASGLTLETALELELCLEKTAKLVETAEMIKNNYQQKYGPLQEDLEELSEPIKSAYDDDYLSEVLAARSKTLPRYLSIIDHLNELQKKEIRLNKQMLKKPDTFIAVSKGLSPVCIINIMLNELIIRRPTPPTIFYDKSKYDRVGTRTYKENFKIKNEEQEPDEKPEDKKQRPEKGSAAASDTDPLKDIDDIESRILTRRISPVKLSEKINELTDEDTGMHIYGLTLGMKALQQKRYKEPDIFISVGFAMYRVACDLPDGKKQIKFISKAIPLLEGVIEKDKSNAQALSTLGLIYSVTGDYKKAMELHEKAVDIASKFSIKCSIPDIYERYGQLLHDNAKRSQADADEAAAKDYAEKAENAFNLAL
ncbi:MAG: FapA family protein, partial [Planctomycetota bacterium]